MKKILLYIILFLSGIDGAWALPIEKEGMSIYSPSLKQEVSYSIILPEGYEHSDTEYPVFREYPWEFGFPGCCPIVSPIRVP